MQAAAGVWFRKPLELLALHECPAEQRAIVGSTGAGKTV